MRRHLQQKGTDNVLADLGFEDAEELSAKTILALKLNSLIETRGISQVEAAKLTRLPQPRISQIRNYKLQNISLERLMQALTALGLRIEIIVSPSTRAAPARISVAA